MFPFRGTVGIDAFGDCVAMDSERFGGVRDALLVPEEGFLNVQLFEFLEGLIQKDVAVQHVFDNCF